MQIKEFLNNVCEQIKYKPIRENIAEELENHIEEAKEDYIREGIKENVAEEKAIEQMGEAKEIGKKLNKIHRPKLDWKLLLIVAILMCFGFLVVLIRINNGLDGYVSTSSIGKYITFLVIGIFLGTIIYLFDYRNLSGYSNIIYLIATGLIVFDLLFGRDVNGIPYLYINNFISINPAIIAIPLFVIAFVGFINDFNKKININLLKIIILSVLSLIVLTLIPSMASVGILGFTYMILATVKIVQLKKNKVKNLIKLWGSVILIGIILGTYILGVSPFRWMRLQVAIKPESDPEGAGWVAMNRKEIIESAKFFGEAENTSDAIDLFDEGTDSAFISILAHYGWSVSIAIVLVIIAFSIKLILNAIKIKDNYGKYIIIGISSMFILQSIFNILINMNMWLDFSLNLPFISYGGTNLVINIMCLALILSIYRRKDIMFIPNNYNKEEMEEERI